MPSNNGIYCSLIIIFVSILCLRLRGIRQELLSSVTAFHLIFLIFFGVGPLTFYFDETVPERISRSNIINTLNSINPYLIIGYSITLFLEFKNRKLTRSNLNLFKSLQNIFNKDYSTYLFFVLTLAIIGNYFSSSVFAKSGIGTILPVLSYLAYPITIFIFYTFDFKNTKSLILLVILFSYFGYQSFFSLWRSQLILFISCFLIAGYLKNKTSFIFIIILSLVVLFYVLPFQLLKREQSEINFSYNEIFNKSLLLSSDVKINYITTFLSQRVNYARELGYVQFALDNNNLEYRDGETYKEIIFQLIPRYLWNDKPSYNSITGFDIPRKVLLLSETDEFSSWGVNIFAEFCYNFNYKYLPIFILVIYLSLNYLDRLSYHLGLKIQNQLVLQFTLFFLTLNLVSIIYSSTYFLWLFIVIILINKISIRSNEDFIIR